MDDLILSSPNAPFGAVIRISDGVHVPPVFRESGDDEDGFAVLRICGPVSHGSVSITRSEALAIYRHLGDRLGIYPMNTNIDKLVRPLAGDVTRDADGSLD